MYRNIKEMSDNELINIALDFADNNSQFNPHFIHAMEETLESFDELTEQQRYALENIIEKWDML